MITLRHYPVTMRGTRDDDVVRAAVPTVSPPGPDRTEPPAPAAGIHALGPTAGAVLAVAATLAVFLTDDARYLRVAVVAVAWAFVGAAFLAGRRTTDQVAAAAREGEPRRRHEREVERDSELAARYDHQLELERRLRRESEDAVRAELTRLRGELAALTEIRAELAGLGELRTELGRLRTELGEQLAGQLTFERMVMRAPSARGAVPPADDRTVESTPARVPAVDPGWDVGRWGDTTVVPARPVPRPV